MLYGERPVRNVFGASELVWRTGERITVASGPGISVGITTDYGLNCPGSNAGGDEIFRKSRSALWPTQPPVQWVAVLSRW